MLSPVHRSSTFCDWLLYIHTSLSQAQNSRMLRILATTQVTCAFFPYRPELRYYHEHHSAKKLCEDLAAGGQDMVEKAGEKTLC